MSTATHGVIDYAASASIALLPRFAGFSKRVTAILNASAGTSAAYSLCTDYELGVVRVLPMKAHLMLDALSGGTLLGAALMLDDEPAEARATLAGIGLFEVVAALKTQTRPSTALSGPRSTRFTTREPRHGNAQERRNEGARAYTAGSV
jgi:hypothetical protein